MAARESDAAIWLQNKLGSTDDLWSGKSICSQLTQDRLIAIQDCFINLQPHVKVKLLLSFLHLPKRSLEEWKMELDDLIELASSDGDQWVSMIGEILRPYPVRNEFATEFEENNTAFSDVLIDLRKAVKKCPDCGTLPLECVYLNKTSLTQIAGNIPAPTKHFALKRKPKSAALRAEILQKSNEAANNTKRPGYSNSLPIRMRSFAKKMDDTSPMRGIPSRTPPSGGFRTPGTPGSSRFGGQHALGGTPLGKGGLKREGGIKLLDIGEQPVGSKEAKRRKRQADIESMAETRKDKDLVAAATATNPDPSSAAPTPDYAAALMSPGVPNLPTVSTGALTTPSYLPATSRLPVPSPSATPANQVPGIRPDGIRFIAATSNPIIQSQPRLPGLSPQVINQIPRQPQMIRTQRPTLPPDVRLATIGTPRVQQPAVTSSFTAVTSPFTNVVKPAAGPVQASQPQQKKGLSLTREQMIEAQELFKHSNKVTRPEKALILGFMAGARENLCKDHGDVVNILLNQEEAIMTQADGSEAIMVTDTYFQMNYSSGSWQKVKKIHPKVS